MFDIKLCKINKKKIYMLLQQFCCFFAWIVVVIKVTEKK